METQRKIDDERKIRVTVIFVKGYLQISTEEFIHIVK